MTRVVRGLPGRVDVLVVGGGMAGLAAGAAAAEGGARVVVIEKGAEPGGSAALSVGMFWAIPDVQALRSRVPLGDPALGRVVVEEYEGAVEEIRAMGVTVGERVSGVMTVGVGHSVDVHALLQHEQNLIRSSGGQVVCGASVRSLHADPEGAVTGATVRGADGGSATVLSEATILATGGFQGDPDLVNSHMGKNAYRMLLRSNRYSVGDGLRLGRSAGGATSRAMGSFYGHLLPRPLERFEERDFMPLAQYHSNRCILVNVRGRRFCNEAEGDEVNNQALLAQPEARGLLICDERIRSTYVVSEYAAPT